LNFRHHSCGFPDADQRPGVYFGAFSFYIETMKVNLEEKLSQIQEHWTPHIIAELNGQQVKLAKLKGEFVWHKHDNEDELFYVIKGQLQILFEDKTVHLGPGEMLVVPKGVSHKPVAEEEVEILLFEPASTLNTGDAKSSLTQRELKKI